MSGERRAAAVLVPIRLEAPHRVIFLRRAAHLRRHAGQIAFPGGALEPADDGDLARAALRESHEEIGLDPARVTVLARLDAVRQIVGPFDIAPFVGVVAPGAPLRPDAGEVAAIHEIPLAAILAPDAVRRGVEPVGERSVPTWHFDHGDVHVWGATGRILATLVAAYGEPDSALRAALAGYGIA